MINTLYIEIRNINVVFMLVNQSDEAPQDFKYTGKLYEHIGKGFGDQIVEAEVAFEILHNSGGTNELENTLTKYYECILVGREFPSTYEDLSFQKLMNEAKKRALSNAEELLESSGLIKRFEDLLKRVRFDTTKYPIDQIYIRETKYFHLMKNSIQKILPNISIVEFKEDTLSLNQLEEEPYPKKKLYLKYLNYLILIMELDSNEYKESCLIFKTKFSLDVSINIEIVESWREKGMVKERSVRHFSFNLPLFYTDEDIRLTTIYQPRYGYTFEMIHVDSGEKETFIGGES
ncbi:hypothetical protein L1999_14175 [Neobacillus drentensis]|uniref:hypothetical protein n=1 Tax=Neobacillus drentensis TaxID=220684 RepID=UPI001F3F1D77|nr:hypothetical protein [Neobacillus drentensis]ULT59595.1 hypothetical protein L1999_14175 [Neobacillus drentensis]